MLGENAPVPFDVQVAPEATVIVPETVVFGFVVHFVMGPTPAFTVGIGVLFMEIDFDTSLQPTTPFDTVAVRFNAPGIGSPAPKV